jgi:serine/threonine-protein kinase
MFTDEARILGALHHPNIVQALDFGADGDGLFLVLEYLEGPSLAHVLRRGRAVPAGIVAYIGREICRALDYMHRVVDADGKPLGLVHRDVTPANIVVTPAGTVKLLDFGVAKFAKALQSTRAGVVKGKSAYLSPEQLGGATDIDGRVDLFALGTLLHELLTGQRLFAADNDLVTMQKILHGAIPAPSRLRPGVPASLDRIVMRALERDRSRRYARAADMARDLDDVVVATGLRVGDVAAFVREVHEGGRAGAPASKCSAGDDLATRRDLLLPMRLWMDGRFSVRRAALVTGLTLALGAASVFGWGHKSHPRPTPEAVASVR